jgi:hypothetical protein
VGISSKYASPIFCKNACEIRIATFQPSGLLWSPHSTVIHTHQFASIQSQVVPVIVFHHQKEVNSTGNDSARSQCRGVSFFIIPNTGPGLFVECISSK